MSVKKITISIAAVLCSLLFVGAIFQQIAETIDRHKHPMPGKLINAGDVNLHIHCTGPVSDQPTIILSAGMGISSAPWQPIQKNLSETSRVCSYDRDGLGWSQDSAKARNAAIAVERLSSLLENANVTDPLIIAGHSYGGLLARIFANRYPDRVVGLVMVDSSHEDMGRRFPPEIQEGFQALLSSYGIMAKLHYSGLIRLFDLAAPAIDGLDGMAHDQALSHLNSIAHMRGSAREAQGWQESAAAARTIDTFGATPLYVLVAGDWPEVMKPSWFEMQTEISQKSSVSQIEFIETANHSEIMMASQYINRVIHAISWAQIQSEGKLLN